jgi:hypothetical protein
MLAACAQPAMLGHDFGNAVRHDMSVHIINPEPSAEPPVYDGGRARLAIERYRTRTVAEPVEVETSGIGK